MKRDDDEDEDEDEDGLLLGLDVHALMVFNTNVSVTIQNGVFIVKEFLKSCCFRMMMMMMVMVMVMKGKRFTVG